MHVLLFLTTYLSGFIAALAISPAIIFALYEVVYFFYPEGRWWGQYLPGVSYSFYIVVFMAVLVVIKTKFKEWNLWLCPQTKWIWLLFFNWAVIYYIAVLPAAHWVATIFYFKMLIIITMAYYLITSSRALDIALWGYMFGASYIGFFTYQVGRNSGNRVEGVGTVDAPDANGIAAAIAPTLVLFLYYFWISDKKWQKVIFAFGGALVANGIILINSRGAFLGGLFGLLTLIYYMYFSKLKLPNQKIGVLMITIFGLIGSFSLIDQSFIDRINTLKHQEVVEEKQSAATRTLFWWAAIDIAEDYPFGKGIGTFFFYGTDYVGHNVDMGETRNRAVHSTWFEALSDTGYLGLFGFIMLILTSITSLSKCKKYLYRKGDIKSYYKVIAIQGALFSFVISMTFINRLRAEVLYWLILYSCAAYNIYILRYKNKDSSGEKLFKKERDNC